MGTELIKKVNEAKSLGLFIDEHLSWTKHIEELVRRYLQP